MSELVFEVTQDVDGGYVAEAFGEGIVTQAETWEELREHVKDAVDLYFLDQAEKPKYLRLHLRKDEVLAVA